MNHREKLAHFDRHLEERGLWKSNAKPPAFWLLWKLGFEVPPPYFLSFRQAWIGAGVPFGLLLGLFSAAVFSFNWTFAAFAALTSGALFGLCMAFLWGWQRDKLDLPPWEEYPRHDDVAAMADSE